MTVVPPSGEVRRISAEDPEMRFYLGTEGQMGAIWDVTFCRPEETFHQAPGLNAL